MQTAQIMRLLPEVFRDDLPPGNVRDAVLALMEAFHAPAEAALEDLDAWFDPARAPDAFVAMLADWVALSPYLNTHDWQQDGRRGRVAIDAGQLRALTAQAASLARERSTRAGLRRFLELATGVRGFVIDPDPVDAAAPGLPFHVRIVAPAAARPQAQLVALVIEQEKPAFTTVELEWTD